jgi:hypothetical protein
VAVAGLCTTTYVTTYPPNPTPVQAPTQPHYFQRRLQMGERSKALSS